MNENSCRCTLVVFLVLTFLALPTPVYADTLVYSVGLTSQEKAQEQIATGSWGTCEWTLDSAGNLTIGAGTATSLSGNKTGSPWYEYRKQIKTVEIADSIDMTGVSNTAYLFSECKQLVGLDLKKLDMSNVTDMTGMFYCCDFLESVDVSNWNTSNVVVLANLFQGCTSLTDIDVSNWDTSKVENMSWAFFWCSALGTVDVSRWDTSNVTDMNSMFYFCSALSELDVSHWNTAKVETFSEMFLNCESLTTLDVSNWSTESATDLRGVFNGCKLLSAIDTSNWNTSNAKHMSCIFENCESLLEVDVSKWDTSHLQYVNELFYNCKSLRFLDLDSWDTSSWDMINAILTGCRSLQKIRFGTHITNLYYWDVPSKSHYLWHGPNGLEVTSEWLKNHFDGEIHAGWYELQPNHTFGEWTTAKNPTCTEAGFRKKICSECGEEVIETIDAMGHTYAEGFTLDKAATCTGEGSESIHCTACGAQKPDSSRSIAKLPHDYNNMVATPTCTKAGYVTHTCIHCGNSYNDSETAALGHKWDSGKVTKTATYANAGIRTYTCRQCGKTKTEAIPTLKRISLSGATISGLVSQTYTGKAIQPDPTVRLSGKTLKKGTDFTIDYKNNVKVGTATVTITGKNVYGGSKSATFKIIKAANPLTVKVTKKTVRLAKVRNRAQLVSGAVTVTKAQGDVTYSSVPNGSSKHLTINKKTGKITVKKGTRKGIYKIKVKISAKGNANYKAGSKIIATSIVVR